MNLWRGVWRCEKQFNSNKKIISAKDKSEICERVLRSLPKWFGIGSAIIDYIKDVKELDTWASYSSYELTGVISINKHNSSTSEIHVMGILESFHQKGIGKILVQEVEKYLIGEKFTYLSVKTLSELRSDKDHEWTRLFYLAMGFAPVEVLKTLWG